MNRKFFNGLLLLALATGGVGTFTSCTDHEQDFQNKVLEDQKDFSDQIAAIRAFLGEPIEGSSLDARIKAVYEDRINGILNRLDDIEANYVTQEDLQKGLDAVRYEVNNLFENYYDKAYIDEKIGENGSRIVDLEEAAKVQEYELAELQRHFDVTFDQLNELFARYALIRTSQITSLIVEQTYNPVFGTLNLPIGLESNMLVGYYADVERDVKFPDGGGTYEGVQNTAVFGTEGIALPYEGTVLDLKTGYKALPTLGNLYLTINPTDVNFNGQNVELVKSNGEALPLGFTAQESDKVLYLGYTRSGNGFYEAEVKSAEETGEDAEALIEATKFEFDSQLKSAFKNIIKTPGKETIAQLAQAIYSQLDGKVPAYAAKVSWTEPVVDGVSVDSVVGTTLSSDGETITRSVLSGYDLAVASFKPLSYSTDLGIDTDKRLPVIGSLKERIEYVFNYLHDHLDFGFKDVSVDDITIDLSGVQVTVDMDKVTINLAGLPVYKATIDADGNPVATSDVIGVLGDNAKVTLGYNGTDVDDANATALKPLVDAIESAIQDMLTGEGDNSLKTQIDSQLQSQIAKIVDQINDQLEGVQAKVYDSLASIQSKVDAELSGSLGSALQSLVDLYDSFAERINSILGGDTSFFQVLLMGYEGNDGGIHHLSSVASDPTYVKKGAIQLFMTSHNFELIVPSFKKYVAITKAGDDVATAALNSQAGNDLNTILDGRQQIIGLNTAALESGKTYQIFYQSLDYRGRTSTMTYYIKVK